MTQNAASDQVCITTYALNRVFISGHINHLNRAFEFLIRKSALQRFCIHCINVAIMPKPCNYYINPKIMSQNAAYKYVLHCLYNEKMAFLKCK